MKKLTLELEALVVESFDTGEDDAGKRGTVQAHVHYTDVRFCDTRHECYTDNEVGCNTNWYGCNTDQCSRYDECVIVIEP